MARIVSSKRLAIVRGGQPVAGFDVYFVVAGQLRIHVHVISLHIDLRKESCVDLGSKPCEPIVAKSGLARSLRNLRQRFAEWDHVDAKAPRGSIFSIYPPSQYPHVL